MLVFFFSSRRRHTRSKRDWSSDVCSSDLIALLREGSLPVHMRASLSVIVSGWALAVVVAVPLGILMGTLKFVEALLEPVVDFVRYLPVSAMIPLLILYVGIGAAAEVADIC